MLPETLQYRRNTDELLATFVRDWGVLWTALDKAALDASFPRWVLAAAAVVGRWRAVDSALAADYLREFTDFPTAPPGVLAPERFTKAMHVTTVATVKRAVSNGASVTDASATAFSRSAGSASRLVLDAGRQTIMGTAVADPSCKGWQRVTSGGCEWCQMLAGRGAVYREETAHFPSHDACKCGAEPVFD